MDELDEVLPDAIVVIMAMFPDAVLNSNRGVTLLERGLCISIQPLPTGVSLFVSSPSWSRKTAQSNNAMLVERYCVDSTAVSDPVEAILWMIEEWGTSDADLPGCAASTVASSSPKWPSASLSKITCERRRWLWFIGFYTPSIREAFVTEANNNGLTGFLVAGKPAVAALEGDVRAIDRFLFTTRTVLFASVPPASRKMTVTLDEGAGVPSPQSTIGKTDESIAAASGRIRRAFSTFREERLCCEPGTHVRGDIMDIGALRRFLDANGLNHVDLDSILL